MAKKVIWRVLALLLLAGVVLGALYYVGRRKSLTVIYEGAEVSELSDISASVSEPLVLEIAVKGDYTVTVLPADDVSFTYKAGGFPHQFGELEDITAGFTVDKGENSLTVTPKGSLQSILQAVHGGAGVVIDDDAVDSDKDLFTLVITNGSKTCRVNFGLYIYSVTGVTLDKEVTF